MEIKNIKLGMTRQEVVDILGEPFDKGCTSRKYRTPSIFKYRVVTIDGDLEEYEFWFQRWKNGKLVNIKLKGCEEDG